MGRLGNERPLATAATVASVGLGRSALGAEWPGDFVKPRVPLEGLGQVFHAEIDRAQGDVLALRVGAELLQGAAFAAGAILPRGQPKRVKFPLRLRDHRGNGPEGIPAGGVFVRGEVVGVGQAAGA